MRTRLQSPRSTPWCSTGAAGGAGGFVSGASICIAPFVTTGADMPLTSYYSMISRLRPSRRRVTGHHEGRARRFAACLLNIVYLNDAEPVPARAFLRGQVH